MKTLKESELDKLDSNTQPPCGIGVNLVPYFVNDKRDTNVFTALKGQHVNSRRCQPTVIGKNNNTTLNGLNLFGFLYYTISYVQPI